MATRVRALIQPVDPRPAGLLLSDPRVAVDLVSTIENDYWWVTVTARIRVLGIVHPNGNHNTNSKPNLTLTLTHN